MGLSVAKVYIVYTSLSELVKNTSKNVHNTNF